MVGGGCPVASHVTSAVEPVAKEWNLVQLMMVGSFSSPEGGGRRGEEKRERGGEGGEGRGREGERGRRVERRQGGGEEKESLTFSGRKQSDIDDILPCCVGC